jgi:hypothetical protein
MEKGLGMEPQSVSEMAHVVSEMKRYASMPIHALAAPQTIPYAQYFLHIKPPHVYPIPRRGGVGPLLQLQLIVIC